MTAARQQRKTWISLTAAAAALVLVGQGSRTTAEAAVTERIVVNPLSGLAISGFDPVAFFTDRKPREGDGAFELAYGGVVWRFCNEGNRAAFAQHPEVYMPRFGGYDPVALGRAVARPGLPTIWLIAGDRLYLFASPEDRDAFAREAEQALGAAERGWHQVEPTLAR
jgi:YHS domain-containing protein